MEKNDTHPPFAWELDLSFCGYERKTSESKENDDTSYMERKSPGMLILLIPVLGYPLKNVFERGLSPALCQKTLEFPERGIKNPF